MTTRRYGQRGVSLVELMVGIAIALIILTGVLTVMLRVSTSGTASVQGTRLNQQMRGTMDFVSRELQRAGYMNWMNTWGAGVGTADFVDVNTDGHIDIRDYYEGVLPTLNQFGEVRLQQLVSGVGTAISGSCPPLSKCNCVLYSYDVDENGSQSTGAFESFGIRRTEDNGRGRIQMRTSGSHDCVSNGWAEITDDNINVTEFSLSMAYSTSTGVGSDSAIYQLDATNGWQWAVNAFKGGIGTGTDECQPSQGTDIDTLDSSDVFCLERRSILIELEGELADDPGVKVKLQNRVKLKNDYLNSNSGP